MDTLVLSPAYEPIERVAWQRAITLWWTDKVEIVEEYQDREIRGVTFSMKVPAVVRFLKSVRARRRSVKFSRENVYARDHGRCAYCAQAVARELSTYDHVVPRKLGGQTSWENVVIACMECNQKKGGRTPEQAGMRLNVHPIKPKALPPVVRMGLLYKNGMPGSWKPYLFDLGN